MPTRRVLITGIGIVSPAGCGKDVFWSALTQGRHAFAPITSFDTAGYRTHVGAELKEGPPRAALAYAEAAAREALKDAGLGPGSFASDRTGVALGTTIGEIGGVCRTMGRHLQEATTAGFAEELAEDAHAALPAKLARLWDLRGPNVMLTTACAAGNYALAYAYEKIASGQTDVMLAGGVDLFSPVVFSGFNRLLAVAPEVCAPFSKGRQGLIPSEGCAILVLEELESARRRRPKADTELLGYGFSSDATHITAPDVSGVTRAILRCLEDSGLSPHHVDYISAHGTGTPANDKTETAAIKRALGERARSVPVSSVKSMLGHAMGAASAFEAAVCALTLQTGLVPSTLHHTPGDPDCDLDYVAEGCRELRPKAVLSNAFAFGGSNCVLALARAEAIAARPARSAPRLVITGLAVLDCADAVARAEELLPDADLRFIDRPIAAALAGAALAFTDAGLAGRALGEGVGIVLESAGEADGVFQYYKDLVSQGPSGIEPRLFPNILANAAASRAAVVFGLKLANVSLAGAFPSGEAAVACAFDLLRRRGAGAILTGGVAGGGAGMLVLETLDEALARKARIYAELTACREGFGLGPEPQAGAGGLEEAVRGVFATGRPRTHQAASRWGGRVSLDLAPYSSPII